MDFSRRPKFVKETDSLLKEYPHVLLLYRNPPQGDITLSEFEDLAFDRLQVLRILEQTTQMGHKLYSTEWKAAVLGYLRKQNLRRYIRLIESTGCSSTDADTQIRREDYISHFILRLAYCRSYDLRNWFIAREIELFRFRFMNLSIEGMKTFITVNNLSYSPISANEKNAVMNGLIQSTLGYTHASIENSEFYKVPFTEVLDLVKNASIYLRNGYAYIPATEFVSCVTTLLRDNLTDALNYANRKLPSLDDDRISNLLSTLHNSYTGKDYTNTDSSKLSITADNLHTYVRKSFPLCMRSLYETLVHTYHLKHFARLQFGLFLKGIGLGLDEAIKFWRDEFCKLIDSDKFDKQYLYNIKHSYGTIGKMTSYTPFGCKKVISSVPSASEQHGCPFKLWDRETMKQKLLEYGVSNDGTKDIIELAAKGHYQIACSKYFIYMHGGVESKEIISHPNQFFDESQDILTNNTTAQNNQAIRKRKYAETINSNSQSNSTQQSTPSVSNESMLNDDFDFSQVTEMSMDAE